MHNPAHSPTLASLQTRTPQFASCAFAANTSTLSLSFPQVPCTLSPEPYAQALGDAEPANTAYSTALALYQQLPDGWVSWGSHCDQMYQASRNTAWLDYAVTCYLQVNLATSV